MAFFKVIYLYIYINTKRELFQFYFNFNSYKKKLQKQIIIRYQHLYWWLIGPPLVTSLLFMYQNYIFVFRRRLWRELFYTHSYLLRFALTFGPIFGWHGFTLYFFMRVVIWFVMKSFILSSFFFKNMFLFYFRLNLIGSLGSLQCRTCQCRLMTIMIVIGLLKRFIQLKIW